MPILSSEQKAEHERKNGLGGFSIDPDQLVWEACGDSQEDPYTRLLTCLQIGSSQNHLEARELRWEDISHSWQPVEYTEDWEKVCDLSGDTPESFMTLNGRVYYLFMTPYC
jgi:hypothetical protein